MRTGLRYRAFLGHFGWDVLKLGIVHIEYEFNFLLLLRENSLMKIILRSMFVRKVDLQSKLRQFFLENVSFNLQISFPPSFLLAVSELGTEKMFVERDQQMLLALLKVFAGGPSVLTSLVKYRTVYTNNWLNTCLYTNNWLNTYLHWCNFVIIISTRKISVQENIWSEKCPIRNCPFRTIHLGIFPEAVFFSR